MKKTWILFLSLILIIGFIGCDKDNGTSGSKAGSIQGTVSDINGAPVSFAYIFMDDSLLVQTDAQGAYSIPSFEAGTDVLLCSGLFFKDTTMEVTVLGGETASLNFVLTPDSTEGKVCGEFQDGTLWAEQLKENPELVNMSAKEACDGLTRATLQAKWLDPNGSEPIYCQVFLGEESLDYTDIWGQYLFRIQAGTYPFTGISDGYKSQTRVIKVLPDGKVYLNFMLTRSE